MPNSKPLQIGITGGIGSGKSTVCKIFSILDIKCYNSDSRARWLMEHDEQLISDIKSLFGQNAYLNKKLNRQLLADQSFRDNARLKALNAAVHPCVARDYNYWLEKCNNESYVIKEAALLFESGYYKNLDAIVVTFAPWETRIKRILKRDPFRNRSEVLSIINNQWSDQKRLKNASYKINNDESESIIEKVLLLDDKFRNGRI